MTIPRSCAKQSQVFLNKAMNSMSEPMQRPWWKEPMVWLVAGLPSIAVIASIATYFIAAHQPDTLVNAGYQKVGMAPGKDTSREDRAAMLSVTGNLEIANGEARLKLSGRFSSMPDTLELLLIHPTHADQDIRLKMKSRGYGEYASLVPESSAGKRQWILESHDQAWRLAGELTLPLDGSIKLSSSAFHNPP
jgi:hypothetical protein